MKPSRLLISGAAVGTIVGTGWADINRTHVFNDRWPPHARFHAVAGWGTIAASQLVALWLTWRQTGAGATGSDAGASDAATSDADHDLSMKIASLLPALAWAPFFVAAATPGAEVEDEPGELPRVVGVPLNLVPATLVPAISAAGYLLHRRGL